MRAPAATITRLTMCPLMSRPRMLRAAAAASSGVVATLTPPALPRPPVFTCALTTTTPPSFSAAALASSGVSATMPASTGTPYCSNRSLAWYSYRSTRVFQSVSAHGRQKGVVVNVSRAVSSHTRALIPTTMLLQGDCHSRWFVVQGRSATLEWCSGQPDTRVALLRVHATIHLLLGEVRCLEALNTFYCYPFQNFLDYF